MTPEKLWLIAIMIHESGHPWAAKRIKQLNSILHHNSLANGAIIGANLHLGHHGLGTVINDNVVIGDNVTIWHNVTLAVRAATSREHGIIIEDNVMIGAGATIITPKSSSLTIGAHARIGAGAVVTHDIPPGVTAVGVPARPVGL